MPLNNDSLTNLDNNSQLVGSSASIDESMPKNSSPVNFSYEKMENPYSAEASRGVTPFFGKNYKQDEGEAVIKTGDSITDIWVNTWIKSKNYLPAKRGFILDAKKGSIECEKLFASDVVIRMVGTGSGFDTTGIEFNDGSFSGANVVKINKNGVIVRAGKGYSFEDVVSGNFSTILVTGTPTVGGTHSEIQWFLTPANKFLIYEYSDTLFPTVEGRLFTVSSTAVFAARQLQAGDTRDPNNPGSIRIFDGDDGTPGYIQNGGYQMTLQTVTIAGHVYRFLAHKD